MWGSKPDGSHRNRHSSLFFKPNRKLNKNNCFANNSQIVYVETRCKLKNLRPKLDQWTPNRLSLLKSGQYQASFWLRASLCATMFWEFCNCSAQPWKTKCLRWGKEWQLQRAGTYAKDPLSNVHTCYIHSWQTVPAMLEAKAINLQRPKNTFWGPQRASSSHQAIGRDMILGRKALFRQPCKNKKHCRKHSQRGRTPFHSSSFLKEIKNNVKITK